VILPPLVFDPRLTFVDTAGAYRSGASFKELHLAKLACKYYCSVEVLGLE